MQISIAYCKFTAIDANEDAPMSQLQIKDFDFPTGKDKPWRVDWIGKVAYNPHVDSEPVAQVLFTALRGLDSPALKNEELLDEHQNAWIGVGQLPLVSIGSVWINGRQHSTLSSSHSGRPESFEVNPSVAIDSTFSGDGTMVGFPYRWIPKSYYPVGTNFKYLVDTPLRVYPVEHPSFKYVLIPPAELLRSYYLCSNKVAHAVFSDDIEQLIQIKATGLPNDVGPSTLSEDGSVLLTMWKTTDDDDAWFIARWFVSPEMQREITSMNRRIMVASANAPANVKNKSHAIPIDINFPFDDATRLSAYGKRMKLASIVSGFGRKDVWAFLVLDIRSCSHPLPFGELAIQRKNDGRKGGNSADSNLPETAFPPSAIPPAQIPPDEMVFSSEEEPNRGVRQLLQDVFRERFLDILRRNLIKNEKEVQKFKSAKGIPLHPEMFDVHGTGEGQSNGVGGKADVRQKREPFKAILPADLKTFLEVVRTIREGKAEWSLITIMVGGRGAPIDDYDVITCFPERIKGLRSWHLMPSGDRPRGVVLVQVETLGRVAYLIELERRRENDKHSVLVVRSEEGAPIPDATFERLLSRTARKKSWPTQADFPRLIYRKVNHDSRKTVQQFAKLLISTIEKLN